MKQGASRCFFLKATTLLYYYDLVFCALSYPAVTYFVISLSYRSKSPFSSSPHNFHVCNRQLTAVLQAWVPITVGSAAVVRCDNGCYYGVRYFYAQSSHLEQHCACMERLQRINSSDGGQIQPFRSMSPQCCEVGGIACEIQVGKYVNIYCVGWTNINVY